MTEDSTITAPNDADTPAIDLYREVHKGLRRALFELVDRAGSLDATDLDAVASFQQLFADLDMMLVTHHAHEDGQALRTLIAQHAEETVALVDAAHDDIDNQLDELRTMVDHLDRSSAADMYNHLVTFIADYLAHMNVEEQQVMPQLQSAATTDDLMAITMAIRTSVPPPDMCVFLRSMLPAMNLDERTATLGGMKMGAPPEIFDMFWGIASENLKPSDLAAVAGRIDAPLAQS